MSTHNIGFYEDLTKDIFQLSSNTHHLFFWVTVTVTVIHSACLLTVGNSFTWIANHITIRSYLERAFGLRDKNYLLRLKVVFLRILLVKNANRVCSQ